MNTNTNDTVQARMLPVINLKAAQAKLAEMQRGQEVVVEGRLMEVAVVSGTKVLRVVGSKYNVSDEIADRLDGRVFQSVHINNHRATAIVSL